MTTVVVCDECGTKFFARCSEVNVQGYAQVNEPQAVCPSCGHVYERGVALKVAQSRSVTITGSGNVVGDGSEANIW